MAYTSASTALNQKLSVTAKPKEPITPLPNIIRYVLGVTLDLEVISLVSSNVMDQNINNIVNALAIPEVIFKA